MRQVSVESVLHKGRRRIKLMFDYDRDLISLVKKINGSIWSHTMKCWHLPYSDYSIEEIKNLQQIQGITVFQIDKLLEERRYRYFDRVLPAAKEESVICFGKWLKSQRYSEKSIISYIHAIRTFFGYFSNKGLHDIRQFDIEAFNYDYILRNKLSVSYQNQAISAIKLFYSVILKKDLVIHDIIRPKRAHTLPGIFSKTEVESLIRSVSNPKHKAILSLIYACGLRRSELIGLRINAIDSKRKLVIIKAGKGNKDRLVPIPEKMIDMLRAYYISYRPKYWLFEGHNPGEQYSESSLEMIFKQALKKSSIRKEVTLHSLRHSYATHLLENGVDLRFIQELLGHKSSRTTEIYTHVSSKSIEKIKSPFENLDL